jgi:cobalt/nickel transport system ATP-binding protein
METKIIEIEGLSFSYPDGNVALRDINFYVHKRETLGVIGSNGAGKSTLLLHLNGLLEGEGKIKICGLEINKNNLKEIRKKVGFVFQDPQDQLFMPTIYEDVAFGPQNLGLEKADIDKRVKYALDVVSLWDKKDHLSYHLSLGEQKRLSIATVLSMSSEIMVLDEPNSNLDPACRRHLINLLRSFNVTKVIATHDLEMILDLADRVILLDSGKIITEGKPREILSKKTLLESHGLEVPLSILLNK